MEASNEDINIVQRLKILRITEDLTDHLFQFNPHIKIKAAYEMQNHIDLIAMHNAVDLFEAHFRQMLSEHDHEIKEQKLHNLVGL